MLRVLTLMSTGITKATLGEEEEEGRVENRPKRMLPEWCPWNRSIVVGDIHELELLLPSHGHPGSDSPRP